LCTDEEGINLMIILAGKKINENEPLFYSLTNIYGIGYSQS